MQRPTNRSIVSLTVVALLFSCSLFRNKVDADCVDQFASEYPPQLDSRFVLPWKVGESYKLSQGNCTLYSHTLANNQHMAFDFKMPIGTPIHAADDGRVALVVERFKDKIDNAFKQANYIVIEHEGGFLSHYGHLTFNGAAVHVDDVVLQGDVIGYSGHTGQSDYPHLHFFVQQLIDDCFNAKSQKSNLRVCPQVPISFFNADPVGPALEEGVTYTATPF